MNILAFDLANFTSSLALMKDGQVVHAEHHPEFRGQDLTLLSRIKDLLNTHGLKFQDLHCFASTTGPGSFTGIRVALATVQGLSLASHVPCIGFSTFHHIWHHYPRKEPGRPCLLILESLRLELYGQWVTPDGTFLETPFSLSPQHIQEHPYFTPHTLCIGNGAFHLKDLGVSHIDGFMPDASHLAEWAATIAIDTYANYPCVPVYVRDADTGK